MKRCLACNTGHTEDDWRCPQCGIAPPLHGDIRAFSKAPSGKDDGFDEALFAHLAVLEPRHFWFTTRNDLIVWAMRKYFPGCRSLMEIGCGTGFVLNAIFKAFPGLALSGSEYSAEGLRFAAQRVPQARLFQMDARHIPFAGEFEGIGVFDVLEHIEQDADVLAEIYTALIPGGGLLVTVPQHPWLWSQFDTDSCHKRRYTRAELCAKVSAAGFTVTRVTSFNSFLLPIMAITRKMEAHADNPRDPLASMKQMTAIPNAICRTITKAEQLAIRSGHSFKVGGSLLLIARKPV
jgi:SAM-dependent methyltransferase